MQPGRRRQAEPGCCLARSPSRASAHHSGSRGDGHPKAGPQPCARARPRHRGGGHGRRPVGRRGDKLAADQAAVDAMRAMLDTVVMDSMVVSARGRRTRRRCSTTARRWGGEKAPGQRRCRPPRGQPPDGPRAAERNRRDRGGERRSMFFPGAAYHGEDRGGSRRRRCDRHQRDAGRERPGGREGEGTSRDRRPRRRARARPSRGADRRAARGGGARESDS